MKLIVGGNKRTIPSEVVNILESQFIDLQASLGKKGLSLPEWIRICEENNHNISTLLRISGFRPLATDIGIAFLKKNNFPCPVGH